MYIYINVYISLYIYISINKYIYIYIYVYIYIRIYAQLDSPSTYKEWYSLHKCCVFTHFLRVSEFQRNVAGQMFVVEFFNV